MVTLSILLEACPPRCRRSVRRGFTLIELVVVLTLVGLLVAIAAPRYFQVIDRGKLTVQRQNLSVMRDAIDKFFGDQGRYPDQLEELVSMRYLREIPVDPVSERHDWITLPPNDPKLGAIYDVQAPAAAEAGGDIGASAPALPLPSFAPPAAAGAGT
jgi:general secretion pathway protein G